MFALDHDIELEDDTGTGFAFDYASARTTDVDGRLHVSDCKISAARVNEYLDSEIPGTHDLDPGRIYRMYRDAAALRAAVPSFENMPLMSQHVAVSASDPQKWLVVGTVSNCRWRAPYIVADLAVWDADAIARIRDGSKREISCGYRYRAVMEPGTINGESFDGRMLDIAANHVALVETGRVGPDCVVADSAPGVPIHVAFKDWGRLSRRESGPRDPIRCAAPIPCPMLSCY
jgi:uncharacterized protein